LRFDELSLNPRLLQAINHLGFIEATEIQQRAIPQILSSHDLAASSKTGSGKTLAFLLPMVQRLMTSKVLSKRGPRALILAPTRELAKQVYGQLRLLLAGTNYKGALILGGENFNEQIKQLQRQPHVLVGTPGRIANHLSERSLFIDGLEILILDEADRMLDLGFANELKQIHEAANHRLRQTLMFSATLAHTEFEELATVLLDAPRRITVGQELAPHEDIEQRFLLCDHLDHKQALLEHLINHESYQQAIIFTATRADTERLAQLFQEKGLSAAALSGDLKQNARNSIMDGFSRGHFKLLFTTDIASRGLDLVHVSLVVNFDMPKAAEEFIHRIGRTGRAGAKGLAISLVGAKDWASYQAVKNLLQLDIPFSELPGLTGKFKGVFAPARRGPKAAHPLLAAKEPKAGGKPKAPVRKARPANEKNRPNKQQPTGDMVQDGFAPLRKRKITLEA
jgi:superfamily II DNA/RNA helicase